MTRESPLPQMRHCAGPKRQRPPDTGTDFGQRCTVGCGPHGETGNQRADSRSPIGWSYLQSEQAGVDRRDHRACACGRFTFR
jgi:hypothetical protein